METSEQPIGGGLFGPHDFPVPVEEPEPIEAPDE